MLLTISRRPPLAFFSLFGRRLTLQGSFLRRKVARPMVPPRAKSREGYRTRLLISLPTQPWHPGHHDRGTPAVLTEDRRPALAPRVPRLAGDARSRCHRSARFS